MKDEVYAARMARLNEVYEETAAEHEGVTYIDAWTLFADEDGGERGPREVSNKDQGGDSGEGGTRCWNPTCAASTWNDDMETSACDYFPYNGRCFCNFMTTPDGGACEAT